MLIILIGKAVQWDFLDESPLRKKVIRFKPNKPENELSDEERERFLAAFDARSRRFKTVRTFGGGRRPESAATTAPFQRFRWTYPFFITALDTGLRLADLRALTYRQIDFDRSFLFVQTQKTQTATMLPLSDRCRTALQECRRRFRFSDVGFVDEAGQPPSVTRIRRAFAIAKELAGITRRLRIHDLRHTYGSRLATEGVDLLLISKLMAHQGSIDDQTLRPACAACVRSRSGGTQSHRLIRPTVKPACLHDDACRVSRDEVRLRQRGLRRELDAVFVDHASFIHPGRIRLRRRRR